MTSLARKLSASPQRWHNSVPAWILEDDRYGSLSPTFRLVLQGVANAADAPDHHGTLVGAIGGRPLIGAIGCSASQFWSALNALERPGYVVLVGRGGCVRVRSRIGVANAANTWGVPGYRGALDKQRVQREQARIVTAPDGRRVRNVTQPGEQATFWDTQHPKSPFSPRGELPAGKSEYPTPDFGVPHSGFRSLPSPLPSPLRSKGHGGCAHGARTSKGVGRRGMPHVEAEDLSDFGRLMRLFGRCVGRGFAERSHAGVIWFVSAAEHATRCARRNPAGMFAATIRNKEQRVLYVTQADEDAALVRIKFGGNRDAARAVLEVSG